MCIYIYIHADVFSFFLGSVMLRLPAVGRALAGAAHSKGNLATSSNGKSTHACTYMHTICSVFR